jgi:hypothetical protein
MLQPVANPPIEANFLWQISSKTPTSKNKHLELSCMSTEKLLEQVLNNQGSVVVNRKT